MKFTLEAAVRYIIENTRDKTQISSNIEKVKKLFAEKSDKCPKGLEYLERSFGTLGGGNHFIEIDEDEEGNKYLLIHTGSR